jgi:hypothetical protein
MSDLIRRCRILVLIAMAVAGPTAAEPALFLHPKSVCEALNGEGLRGGQWRRDDEGFEDTNFQAYKCLSEGLIIPGGGNGSFVTSMNYFAEGRTNDRVEIVKLVLNVHNRKTREAGRGKFVATSKALFRALAIEPPAALVAALEQSVAGVFPFDGGRIRFEVWSVPVERQRLTIETSAVLRR